MKAFLKALFVMVFFAGFLACTKDCPKIPDAKKNIEGLWIGTYTADLLPADPARYYSFIIKPNGKLLVEGEPLESVTIYGTGTWRLDSTTLSCAITYKNTVQGVEVQQSTTAKVNLKDGKITDGVWTNLAFPGGTGKFTMSKIE
jgi:hypothetical protein